MSTERQIEANRRNAQKSTGPRTEEGKNRSRFNAFTHGMTAKFDVLPGEEADALKERIDAWIDDLKPRNEIERELIEQAARLSWQLDRVELAHVARLTANILKATSGEKEAAENDAALVLGPSLFEDWPEPDYANPGSAEDSIRSARIVVRLESTWAGCNWLLNRWAELRSLLDQGQAWQASDKLKAIRLLGRQPLQAFDDSRVAVVFLASHTIDPSGGELPSGIANESILGGYQIAVQRFPWLQPRDQAEARAALVKIVELAVGRLETMAEAHRQRDARDRASAPDLHAFDYSRKGELLRNYEASCSRAFLRAIDTFTKVRLTGNAGKSVPPARAVESSTELVASVAHEIPENEPNLVAAIDTQARSAAPVENENVENEPNFVDISDTGAESAAPVENENVENESNLVAISDTKTESTAVPDNEFAENEPNFVCTNNPTEVNNGNRKRKVIFRGDGNRFSMSRARSCLPHRNHWPGSSNRMRPSSMFGVGRRCASDRGNCHRINSRTTSTKVARKRPVTGAGRCSYT